MPEHTERQKPETLRLRKIMPALTVADIAASIDFYKALGFVVHNEMRHEDKLVGASLKAGSGDLMLAQDDGAQGWDRVKGVGVRLYCSTAQDVDQVAAAIKSRGGTLETEPTDQPWGARDFTVVDPDGFKLSISSWLDE